MTWNDKKILAKIRRHYLDKLELVGEFVEGAATLLCPVDLGNLKSSINHKVHKKDMSVTIGTPVEYAPYVEFGTGEKAENGMGRKGGWFYTTKYKQKKGHLLGKTKKGKFLYFTFGSKPQPFLRPALKNNKKKIKRILGVR